VTTYASFYIDSAPPVIYTLSLHDALPIWCQVLGFCRDHRRDYTLIAKAREADNAIPIRLTIGFDRILVQVQKPFSYLIVRSERAFIQSAKTLTVFRLLNVVGRE